MGGSSGGGSSGEVSWPQWISELHKTGAENMLAALIGTTTSNPYVAESAYNPTSPIEWMDGEMDTWRAAVTAFDPAADWSGMINTVAAKYEEHFNAADKTAAAVAAYSAMLDDDLVNNTLPRFRGGMRDINAVQSTAFVVGEALLEAFKGREVAKYAAEYQSDLDKQKTELVINTAGKLLEPQMAIFEMRKELAKTGVEVSRIALVALKEQRDTQLEIDEAEHKWDSEKWSAYGSYIGGMSGGTASGNKRTPSTAQSAIGGALSGAAAGGSMGGWWGAAGGAILGAGSAMMNR